ncbi:MAG TPA: acetate/propionate family kinase [Streptosporangiaceae bacterium]|nr:acetate/propionate family kinase [Streptosporangiaceae bacterium]
MTSAGTGTPASAGSARASASVIVLNAGSSSLKASLIGAGNTVDSALELDEWDGSGDHPELTSFLTAAARAASVVAHRVVHGGNSFRRAVLIDDSVIDAIQGLTDLAPLHQPRALAGIQAARRLLPRLPAVACFDTAFHADMPDAAARYALPGAWVHQFGLRRFGFHGLSHEYATRRAAQMLGRDLAGLRIVSCHLGAGASLAAVQGGRSVDTTMGFTPLEGLVMATRSGTVDPGLITWLLQHGRLGLDEVAAGLEQSSGLAGLSGLPGGDVRDVQHAAADGDPAAQLAIEVYLHRLRREIAAMAAAMNGLDVLVFTGGIGEHNPAVRARAAEGLGFLGIGIDSERNLATADAVISRAPAAVTALVITAREDVEMARQARQVLARQVLARHDRQGVSADG